LSGNAVSGADGEAGLHESVLNFLILYQKVFEFAIGIGYEFHLMRLKIENRNYA